MRRNSVTEQIILSLTQGNKLKAELINYFGGSIE